ncbi:hypothetical protein BN1180_00593 [Peribacillus simplex]|uniref:Uncharacterized protein n=1 Tax=Peribacillus simplex TaxID=1478 RepID=A0AAN2PDG4_9BACI|nr:hypothetical protein BN1180_00593 [Peribacillus simplex]
MIAASKKGTCRWPFFFLPFLSTQLLKKGICIHPKRLYQMPDELMVKMDIRDSEFEGKSIS